MTNNNKKVIGQGGKISFFNSLPAAKEDTVLIRNSMDSSIQD